MTLQFQILSMIAQVLAATVIIAGVLFLLGLIFEKPLTALWERSVKYYEQKKKENAERRAEERKRERAEKRIPELEEEISKLDEELFGSAATDYVRAAEIEKRKEEIEEELLSLYEIVMD